MLKRVKINLAETLFEHLCYCISLSHHKPKVIIHHPRLISELLRQSKLIEVMRSREKLRVFNTSKFDGQNLVNLKLIKAKNLVYPMNPLMKIYEEYLWCDGFPTISEHDNEDVIKNFLEMVRRETGYKVDKSMVVGVPDWDLFNNPKEKQRTRTRKDVKKVVFEEPAGIAEAENEKQNNNDGNDSVDELVDNHENQDVVDAEKDKNAGTSERQEVGNVEKERRTKKRNERPSSSEESKMTLTTRVAKKLETIASRPSKKAASTPKGKVSEPNVDSTSEVQIPPLNQTINFTKPISMILPDPPQQTVNISSSSSSSSYDSSEDTLTDSSSETLQDILRKRPKLRTKTPVVKEFVSDGNSFFDHLALHLSGDAFTTSNLNSPNHPIKISECSH
jgi:hypothetical protein